MVDGLTPFFSRWDLNVGTSSHHLREFGELGKLVTHLSLFQPSSAVSERVFSILEQNFEDSQTQCLQDLKETTCKLIYNNRKS